MIVIPMTYFQVRDLLQKEPAERPLAQEILFNRLPEVSNDSGYLAYCQSSILS